MKFRKFGQILLASVVSVGMAGLTACVVQTGDFVYVTSSKNDPGQINVYKSDINSGTLKKLSVSPYTMRYRNPVALVVSPDSRFLYVAYRDDNVIQEYGIGTDGKIYPQHSYNTPGSYPISLGISANGDFLYVLDTYQPGYSDASPGQGALIVYPIVTDSNKKSFPGSDVGALASPISNQSTQYWPVGTIPTVLNTIVASTGAAPTTAPTSTLISVSPDDSQNQRKVFVATLTKSGTAGAIYAFTSSATGALTALGAGDTSLGTDAGAGIYAAGVQPSSIVRDASGNYLYLSDYSSNKIRAYSIQSAGLAFIASTSTTSPNPISTGNNPISLTIEPRNKFLYAANYTDGSLNGYTIGSNGMLTAISGASTVATTGAQPTCVFVEPRTGRYVYTTDFYSNTVTAFQLNATSGSVVLVEKSPFQAASQPTCGVAVAHGKTALSTD